MHCLYWLYYGLLVIMNIQQMNWSNQQTPWDNNCQWEQQHLCARHVDDYKNVSKKIYPHGAWEPYFPTQLIVISLYYIIYFVCWTHTVTTMAGGPKSGTCYTNMLMWGYIHQRTVSTNHDEEKCAGVWIPWRSLL